MRDGSMSSTTQSQQRYADASNTSAATPPSTDSYFLSESPPFVDLNDEDVQEDFYAYGVRPR